MAVAKTSWEVQFLIYSAPKHNMGVKKKSFFNGLSQNFTNFSRNTLTKCASRCIITVQSVCIYILQDVTHITFGEKLRKYRKENGLTQAQLAKLAGLGLRTIINYEKGATYPQDHKVYTILAEILDVDPHYLHNENDDFMTDVTAQYSARRANQS